MEAVEVQFIGSGDAFGSGGRFQTCIMIRGAGVPILLDCGASSLVAMRRAGVDPTSIAAVVVTHLHGDHFGGVPFLILDGQFNRRTQPLMIVGPPGSRERIEAAMEVLYSGSSKIERRFSIEFRELLENQPIAIGDASVTGFEVDHRSGAKPFAVRLDYESKVISYSGDTQWTDNLINAARDADLFILECYAFDKPVKYHLDIRTIESHVEQLGCRRLILTHMGPEMLQHSDELQIECASDGKVILL
jgi:ribonuclease BN (tRNA processing enzyme)